MTDLISRADAIDAVRGLSVLVDDKDLSYFEDALNALPSADAEPTVIRAKTFMRKEDFDKWADDIKKQGENIICIPCDAEVVPANVVPQLKGEWVIRENGNKECSLCGHERQDGWDYFCGYCGAKMQNGFKSVGQAWNTEQRR